MNKTTYFLILIVLLSCTSKKSTKNLVEEEINTKVKETSVPIKFPELKEGEIQLEDDCFGEVVELKGKQIITNEIFKIRSTQMLVKDSLLIVKNNNQNSMFMAFSLPDFKLTKTFGKKGKGPDEFQFPTLVPTEGYKGLCYVHEKTTNKLSILNQDLNLNKTDVELTGSKTKKFIADKQIHSFSENEFVYVESIEGGKGIFHHLIHNDTIKSELVQNLSFSEKYKSWANYIGDFGASKDKKRMVFAYKYFKRIVFMDTKSGKTRVLSFDETKAKKGGDLHAIMSPQNITHYWGISTQKEHVYFLYSGRAPVDVVKERGDKNYYIYVEKFDWNGNPVKKYKLDNWGYFCVDEKHGKLYLASTNHAEAFFEYDLSNL